MFIVRHKKNIRGTVKKAQAVSGIVKRHFKELIKEDFIVISFIYMQHIQAILLRASMSPHLEVNDKDYLLRIQRR